MLLAQVQEREIEGVIYHVLPLPSGVALRMAARVLKMASPAFSDVGSLIAASQAVTGMLEGLAAGLLGDLDVDILMWCADEFAKVTQFEIGGHKLPMVKDGVSAFDTHFQGRFVASLKWLAFAASVTFPFAKASATAAPGAPPTAE